MMVQDHNLNVLLIQYHPSFNKFDENIKKVEKLIQKYQRSHLIDIIVFPEMAFTGYNFESIDEIKDCFEEFDNGKTFDFCSNLSKKLNCYVFCGFPEKCNENGKEVYYNSCLITDREGKSLPSYKKTFLYETDKNWCIEGKGFGTLKIKTNTGKELTLGIGICMDLNPYEFTAPFEKMEFANFCKESNVDCIVFLTNWLDNEPNDLSEKSILNIINYWCTRCTPLLKSDRTLYFLAADRCGKEKNVDFIGCSCIIKLGKKPRLIDNLNKKEENTIYCSLNLNSK